MSAKRKLDCNPINKKKKKLLPAGLRAHLKLETALVHYDLNELIFDMVEVPSYYTFVVGRYNFINWTSLFEGKHDFWWM